MGFLSVSEVARRLGARPRHIADLFYQRRPDDKRCPVIGGRRIVPVDYLGEIEAVLREQGRLEAAPC
jgi:hypothetical protein